MSDRDDTTSDTISPPSTGIEHARPVNSEPPPGWFARVAESIEASNRLSAELRSTVVGLHNAASQRWEANWKIMQQTIDEFRTELSDHRKLFERGSRRFDATDERIRTFIDRVSSIMADLQMANSSGDSLLEGVTVVIVEDEPALALTLSRICKSYGADVLRARTSVEARAAIAAARAPAAASVDLLLGDGETGMALIRELRANRSDVGVVILTGSISPIDQAEATALDVQVVDKPFRPSQLVKALAEAAIAAKSDSHSGDAG